MAGGVHPVDGRGEVRLVPELRHVGQPAGIAWLHKGLIVAPQRHAPGGDNHSGESLDQPVSRAIDQQVVTLQEPYVEKFDISEEELLSSGKMRSNSLPAQYVQAEEEISIIGSINRSPSAQAAIARNTALQAATPLRLDDFFDKENEPPSDRLFLSVDKFIERQERGREKNTKKGYFRSQ